MQWFVYILRCIDNSLYIGRTTSYKRRVRQHNQGKGSKFTKNRIPVKLVYLEEFNSRHSAYKREFQIKGWSRVKKENLIKYGKPNIQQESS